MKTMKMTVMVMALCVVCRQGWCGGGGMAGGGGTGGGGGMGGGMGGGTGGSAPEEVNIPDLLAQFEPSWTTVTLSASLGNPERVNAPSYDEFYNLHVYTQVVVPESIHLVGTTYARGAVADAVNASDEQIEFSNNSSSFVTYTRLNINPSTGQRRSLNHAIVFDVNPEQKGYPLALSKLRWSVKALIARRFEDVEVPFRAARNRISLTDNVSVRVEEAVCGDQTYKYRLSAAYTGADPFAGHFIRVDDGLPAALVLDIELLDSAGRVINRPGTPGAFTGGAGGGAGTTTITGSGNCAQCGGVERMRFVIARGLVEEEIVLSLADLPVPSF